MVPATADKSIDSIPPPGTSVISMVKVELSPEFKLVSSKLTVNCGASNWNSASTANVSGVASLIWGVNPSLSAGQIKAIMSETAYDLENPGYDNKTGYGFVNADAAVRRALALARGFD